jgi:hypothetical protein
MNVVEKYKLKFQDNKKSVIRSFSKKELMDELMKREGVTSYICPKENEFEVKIYEGDGDGEWGYGRATILVVK